MSRFIKLKNVFFSYGNLSSDLLKNISFALHEGFTSVCGPNGCGKTTLFKLILGQLIPTQGNIEVLGDIFLVEQNTEIPPAHLHIFKHDFSPFALYLRSQLGILDEWFERYDYLSIGERKKLQIATALFLNPDILLIDEPTNHLDEASKRVVLDVLRKFKGIGLLISHDRLLLNQLAKNTIFIESGACKIFHAPYDIAKSELEKFEQERIQNYELTKQKLFKTKASIQRQTEKIDAGQKKLSKKNISKKDHDAKEKIDRARLFSADVPDSRKKHVLDTKVAKLKKELSVIPIKKEYNLGVNFREIQSSKNMFLSEGTLKKNFITIHYPTINLKAGDKLAISGSNGVGKSTFLNFWLTQINLENVAIAKQELSQEEQVKLNKALQKIDNETKGKILTLVNCFGSNPKTIVQESIPSPGVWQKIVIAKAIVEGAPILFLDEPTNHMDLNAVEILEEALQLYQGIIVMISHDRVFIEKLKTKEMHLTREQNTTTCELIL